MILRYFLRVIGNRHHSDRERIAQSRAAIAKATEIERARRIEHARERDRCVCLFALFA
jgi:hypothetical protein